MKKLCGICGRDLRGEEHAVYSQSTKAWYCAVGEWDACAAREDKNAAKEAA